MKKIFKSLIVLVFILTVFSSITSKTYAAVSFSVSANKTNAYVGDTITINASYNLASSDSAVAEISVASSSSSVVATSSTRQASMSQSGSFKFTFKANSIGSSVITATFKGGDVTGRTTLQKQIRLNVVKSPVTTNSTKTVTESVPFKTITRYDNTLLKGKSNIIQKGVNGLVEITYKLTLVDGVVTNKTVVSRKVTQAPKDEIVAVGTKVEQTQTPTTPEEPKPTKSSDATLSMLKVSGAQLSPAFSPEVDKYTVQLGSDVTSVEVSATKGNENATVSGLGKVEIPNKAESSHQVVVTAEDGSSKTITLIFKKDAKDETSPIDLGNGLTYTPTEKQSIPAVYKAETYKINDQEVTIYTNANGQSLVLATNQAKETHFYRFDKTTNKAGMLYQEIKIGDKVYVIESISDDVKRIGMSLGDFKFDDKTTIKAFNFDDKALGKYKVLYLSTGNQKPTFYLYDTETKALLEIGDAQLLSASDIQKLVETKINEKSTTDVNLNQDQNTLVKILLAGIIGLSLLSIVLALLLLKKSRSSQQN